MMGSVPTPIRDVDDPQIAEAVARLRAGGLVAFPTETVYGLGADATSAAAVAQVFAIKQRPATNPLIVHVENVTTALRVVAAWPNEAQHLADAFWPGPLSIILDRRAEVPDIVTGGGPGVAVRCPNHPLALRLLRAFGGPLVGPSANLSGQVSPTRAEHVRQSFDARDVLVLDGGPCRAGIESTVVSLREGQVRVLRPGPISEEDIGAALGVSVARVAAGSHDASATLASPGLLDRHYAPRTPACMVEQDELGGVLASLRGRAVVLSHVEVNVPAPHVRVAMPASPREYAAGLYSALRDADALGVERIVIVRPAAQVASVGESALWRAILDRLTRATISLP